MPLALLAGIAACLAVYALNGLIVGGLGLDPLIVTLAAWIWARGLAVSLTERHDHRLRHGLRTADEHADPVSASRRRCF